MPEAAQRNSLLPTPPTRTTTVGMKRLGGEETQGSGELHALDCPDSGRKCSGSGCWGHPTLSLCATVVKAGSLSPHTFPVRAASCRVLSPTRARGQDDEDTDVTEALQAPGLRQLRALGHLGVTTLAAQRNQLRNFQRPGPTSRHSGELVAGADISQD